MKNIIKVLCLMLIILEFLLGIFFNIKNNISISYIIKEFINSDSINNNYNENLSTILRGYGISERTIDEVINTSSMTGFIKTSMSSNNYITINDIEKLFNNVVTELKFNNNKSLIVSKEKEIINIIKSNGSSIERMVNSYKVGNNYIVISLIYSKYTELILILFILVILFIIMNIYKKKWLLILGISTLLSSIMIFINIIIISLIKILFKNISNLVYNIIELFMTKLIYPLIITSVFGSIFGLLVLIMYLRKRKEVKI